MQNAKKAVTLKDIALKTGFTVNTVSHALHDKPDISPKTKGIVHRAANEMGYIANSFASYLRSGISKIIALIIGDISNPHFAIIAKEIDMGLKDSGYTVIIFNSEEDPRLERQAIITALSQNVDGIIICPAQGGEDNIKFIQSRQIPFVLLGRRIEGLDTNYTICNDTQGGYLATKYLIENGHKEILFLNSSFEISSARERLDGYCGALNEAGIPYREDLQITLPAPNGRISAYIQRMIKEQKGFTGVLAFNDMLAWEVIYLLNQNGRRVPDDCSVVGFDDIASKYHIPIQLSSITSAKTTMARKALDILFGSMSNPNAGHEQIVLDTKLVERNTVRRINVGQ